MKPGSSELDGGGACTDAGHGHWRGRWSRALKYPGYVMPRNRSLLYKFFRNPEYAEERWIAGMILTVIVLVLAAAPAMHYMGIWYRWWLR